MRPGAPPALWEARPSRPIRNSHGSELPQAEGAACLIDLEGRASCSPLLLRSLITARLGSIGGYSLVAPTGRRSPRGPRPAPDLASLPEVSHEDLHAAVASRQ